jgi:hypothetical protein
MPETADLSPSQAVSIHVSCNRWTVTLEPTPRHSDGGYINFLFHACFFPGGAARKFEFENTAKRRDNIKKLLDKEFVFG